MNSSPYMLPSAVAGALILLAIAGHALYAIATRDARGRHARRPAVPFADPQDQADPDGSQFIEQISDPQGSTGPPPLDALARLEASRGILAGPDLEWWKQLPPPPAVEVITGPGTSIRQTSALTLSVLAKVRDALMPDAWRPEPGEVTFTPADPDATRTDLQAVEDAPQYLAAPQ